MQSVHVNLVLFRQVLSSRRTRCGMRRCSSWQSQTSASAMMCCRVRRSPTPSSWLSPTTPSRLCKKVRESLSLLLLLLLLHFCCTVVCVRWAHNTWMCVVMQGCLTLRVNAALNTYRCVSGFVCVSLCTHLCVIDVNRSSRRRSSESMTGCGVL